jgi:hypothetical protein
MLTRHCWKCGREYPLAGSPGRTETCECNADLKCCLNCTSYDPKAAEQCRDRRAELVHDKAAANFCEWFEFARREWVPKAQAQSREAAARAALKRMLG